MHAICYFMAMHFARVPRTIAIIERAHESMKDEGQYTLPFSAKDVTLLAIVNAMRPLAERLMTRAWSLVVAPDDSPLVTSDCPASLNVDGDDQSIDDAGSVAAFPLTRNVGLFGKLDGARLNHDALPHELLNYYTLKQATRFIVAPDDTFKYWWQPAGFGQTFESFRAWAHEGRTR